MAVDQPVVQTIASVNGGTPAVIQVSFDLWTLRITMQFPGISAPTYVEFENVSGFRVLDEGNLLEFWCPEVRKPGWLWLVEAGGWRLASLGVDAEWIPERRFASDERIHDSGYQ
jgi:hypothetical protein